MGFKTPDNHIPLEEKLLSRTEHSWRKGILGDVPAFPILPIEPLPRSTLDWQLLVEPFPRRTLGIHHRLDHQDES